MKETLDTIRQLVANARLDKAFSALHTLLANQPQYAETQQEVDGLKRKWEDNRKAERQGIRDDRDIRLVDAQVTNGLLSLIRELQNPTQVIENHTVMPTEKQVLKKILFFASSPLDQSRMQVDREVAEINKIHEASTYRNKYKIIPNFATTPDRFLKLLLREKPYILHFSGHGEKSDSKTQGGLVLSDDQNYSQVVKAETFARLFANLPFKVHGVIFNACFSEEHGKALLPYVDYVIGMNTAVLDKAAIKFAIGFYNAFFESEDVKMAFQGGLFAVDAYNLGVNIPQLLEKS